MSAERRAEAAGHVRPQIGHRDAAGDVHAAVDQAVDERADDLGAVQDLAVSRARVRRDTIEVHDLTIEQDDRNFRPAFLVNGRTAATGSAFGFTGPPRVKPGLLPHQSESRL